MKKRLLIVEDDSLIAQLEKDYLSANGYDVSVCTDGVSGLAAAINEEYNLIILDVMLPGINGFDVCKKLRETKNTPVLFVTAKQEADDVIEGLSLGADDYITKPFNFKELVARVDARIARFNSLVSGKSNNEAETIEKGCIKLCRNSRRVFSEGIEVSMTNKEFDLLWYLASNPNTVFSKEELFNEIWGYDSMGETSTVTVHINRIRDKVDKNSVGIQHIETIWGTGYRFIG